MNEEVTTLMAERIERLLVVMGFAEATVKLKVPQLAAGSSDSPPQQVHLDIDAGESGRLLIGAHGAHLAALQHMIRVLLRRTSREVLEITVDVNGYRAGREQMLLRMAEEAVREAHRTGRAVVLPPMASAERRVIHTALAARPNVTTESLGEEPHRRVAIKPVAISTQGWPSPS